MKKNTSGQKWRVFAFNLTTNVPVTGDAANITAKISKDYGTRTAIVDTNPTEAEDGYYYFDLTQEETNADLLEIFPESVTSLVQVIGVPGREITVPVVGNGIVVGGLTQDAMDQLATSGIIITGNTGPDGYLEIVQGDDYPSLVVAETKVDQWPDLTTATEFKLALQVDGVVTTISAPPSALGTYPDGRQFIGFPVTSDETAFDTIDMSVVNGNVHAVALFPGLVRRTLIRPTAIARVLKSIVSLV